MLTAKGESDSCAVPICAFLPNQRIGQMLTLLDTNIISMESKIKENLPVDWRFSFLVNDVA